MDPVTALGTAISGWDFLKDIYAYYGAWRDCDDDVAQLRRHLLALQAAFGATIDALQRPGLSIHDKSQVEAALLRCQEPVDSLGTMLEQFNKQSGKPWSAWQKLKQHGRRLIYPFRTSTIQALTVHIERCQDILNLSLDLLSVNVAAFGVEKMQSLDDHLVKLVNGLQSTDDALKAIKISQTETEAKIVAEIAIHTNQLQKTVDQSISEVKISEKAVIKELESAAEERKAQKIVNTLEHEQLHRRRNEITDTYADTFHWILDEDESHFARWLRADGGIFWISGKAGSGKSTLMKFIIDDQRTEAILQHWAGSHPLLVVDHFFWVSGTPLQKTNQGLLQALLHQVLQANLNLLPIVCERRWQSSQSSFRKWGKDELFQALEASIDNSDTKYCFFIDGLDEYHPESEHKTLIDELLKLSRYENVKLVVSSRPWTVFQRALSSLHDQLLLEEVNRRDILKYIKGRMLDESADRIPNLDWQNIYSPYCLEWKTVSTTEREWHELVRIMVQGAQGVFLWVRLVLNALCERLAAGQHIDALWSVVNSFPSELEDYFRDQIFKRMNETWMSEAAFIFKFLEIEDHLTRIRASTWSPAFANTWILALPEYGISFLRSENYAEQLQFQWPSEDQWSARVSTVRRFVNASCRDLVAVHAYGARFGCGAYLTYSHRTIRDFLRGDEMQSLINTQVPKHFNDGHLIFRCEFADVKSGRDFAQSFDAYLVRIWERMLPQLKGSPAGSKAAQQCAEVTIRVLKALKFDVPLDLHDWKPISEILFALITHGLISDALVIAKQIEHRKILWGAKGTINSWGAPARVLARIQRCIVDERNDEAPELLELQRLVLQFPFQQPNDLGREGASVGTIPKTNTTRASPWESVLRVLVYMSPRKAIKDSHWEMVKLLIISGADLCALVSVPICSRSRIKCSPCHCPLQHLTAITILKMTFPETYFLLLDTLLWTYSQPDVEQGLKFTRRVWLLTLFFGRPIAGDISPVEFTPTAAYRRRVGLDKIDEIREKLPIVNRAFLFPLQRRQRWYRPLLLTT